MIFSHESPKHIYKYCLFLKMIANNLMNLDYGLSW